MPFDYYEILREMPFGVAFTSLLLAAAFLSYCLAWACDPFEEAAHRLGRSLPTGVKGATINAIGSSMPELFTTVGLLFVVGGGAYAGNELLGAGIAVTAGSAIFNSNVIPMAVIFVVLAPSAVRLAAAGFASASQTAAGIKIDKSAVARDFIFLVIAELILIYFLSAGVFTAWHAGVMLGFYASYCSFMLISPAHDVEDEPYALPCWKAWFQIAWSTLLIVLFCILLADVIVAAADILGVHPIITALFIGAGASSVPDTIMSVKMAMKGEYDDAIANALGSNTFDICVALGAPILAYTLLHGSIAIPEHEAIQSIRVGLLVFTVVIAAAIILPSRIRLWHGFALAAIYAAWTLFALNTEFRWW
ncbi:sodium:calcium antiporter [Roseibium sp. Sym1]|uniref:sodium:calcium antiporter n=1 Tax=Roseibium sp. Sym1 TaxID=3016006 RepID=UPI0022B57CE6|nr:hypothetical protein [Roseibium sp. Sym1]